MVTIIALGNGGYNIARDIIDAKLFHSANLLLFDSDSARIRKHSECKNGNFLLQAGDYFFQRNKVKIVEIIKNINTDEVILKYSIVEDIVKNKYGDNLPDHIRAEFDEIEVIKESLLNLLPKMKHPWL